MNKNKADPGSSLKVIGFVLFPERGGYFPTFKLAKALKQKGFEVIYFGTSEFESDVLNQGLNYQVLFEKQFGKDTFDAPPLPPGTGAIKRLKHNLSLIRYRNFTLHQALASGEIVDSFNKSHVDLLLVDALLSPVAMFASDSGLPVITLATELVGNSHKFPPHTSYFKPTKLALIAKPIVAIEWAKFRIRNKVISLFMRSLIRVLRIPAYDPKILNKYEELKKQSDRKLIHCEYGRRPLFPEFVLCPKEFDFDVATNFYDQRKYIGHCIDLLRHEPEFPWSRIDERPVIYCSLGTHVADYPPADRFFRVLISVARRNPQYSFVVSMGPGRQLSMYGSVPSNVIALARVPQLAILKKASAMITNGGLGTVKECIYFAVPMLALPCDFDQPGNSARICFHKIGRRDSIRRISAGSMGKHIDALLTNPIYKENIRKMSAEFRREKDFEKCIQTITDTITHTPQADIRPNAVIAPANPVETYI